MTKCSWSQLRQIIVSKGLTVQWSQDDNSYTISALDGNLELSAIIPISNPPSSDQNDFEINYKANGNKQVIQNANVQAEPPYGSKTIVINGVTKKLYARFTGVQYSVNQGANTLSYTATYPWVKLVGVECVGCETLDTVDFKVYDTAQGTYSGVPNALLNQFSYSLNLPKDFYQRMAQFDADLYQGMVIQIAYGSQSAKTIGINFLMDEVKS